MKKRLILIAGLMSIMPGFAFAENTEAQAQNPLPYTGVTVSAPASHRKTHQAGFAAIEPLHRSTVTHAPADGDNAARLRLVAWLFGPSIMAMAMIARRRNPGSKPG